MEKDYFHRVSAQTPTRFWINNVTRQEAVLAIEAGACGCTQNPSFPHKMLINLAEKEYVYDVLDRILASEADDNEAQIKLQRELVGNIARAFMPLYKESQGRQGYVSIQGDPFKEDVDTIIKYARYNHEISPNIMAKIPVTEDGLKAIEVLAAEGMPINATEVMSVRQAMDVCEVYEKATRGMSVRPIIYYSHISGILDEYLQNEVRRQNIDVSPDALWQAGIAAAKKSYQLIKEKNYTVGFIGGGARGLHHFTEMVGADAVVTINWKGTAEDLLLQNPPVVQRFLQPTPLSVIDELCEKIEAFRKCYFLNAIQPHEYEEFGPVVLFRQSFENSWHAALKIIAQRRLQKG